MIRMLKNTLIMSIVMLAVLGIFSYAHAGDWDYGCNGCHEATKKEQPIKFTMKRAISDPWIAIYFITVGDKMYVANSEGGIVEYR